MTANLSINEFKTWTVHSSEKYVGHIAKTHVLTITLQKKKQRQIVSLERHACEVYEQSHHTIPTRL